MFFPFFSFCSFLFFFKVVNVYCLLMDSVMSPNLREVQNNVSEEAQLLNQKVYNALFSGDYIDFGKLEEAESQCACLLERLRELNGND